VLAVAGLGVGLAASVIASRALKSVFPTGPDRASIDVVGFLLVGSAVLAVTLLAAFLPARRASRINPTEALRCE
jgi:putative ABC transport system permease protein